MREWGREFPNHNFWSPMSKCSWELAGSVYTVPHHARGISVSGWYESKKGVTSQMSPVSSIKAQLAPAQQVSACISSSLRTTCPATVVTLEYQDGCDCALPMCWVEKIEMQSHRVHHLRRFCCLYLQRKVGSTRMASITSSTRSQAWSLL